MTKKLPQWENAADDKQRLEMLYDWIMRLATDVGQCQQTLYQLQKRVEKLEEAE